MYLLMSVWLAMHASVVAQTSGVRLLTQFVRLPIPTWKYLEKMRTHAASFETLGSNMFRIPFLRSPAPNPSQWNQKSKGSFASAPVGYYSTADVAASDSAKDVEKGQRMPIEGAFEESRSHDPDHTDIWGLEEHGHDIPELQDKPPASRPHVDMVRKEALHWQCHDAFARVAMSFGTNQLLSSITYYCMGYVSLQDGAPMTSWCVAALMISIAVTLLHLDYMLTPTEFRVGSSLLIAGPACVSLCTFLTTVRSPRADMVNMVFLPIAYMAHAAWLLWSLQALGMVKHPSGAWLPMRYRAVSYLDVYKWYHTFEQCSARNAQEMKESKASQSAKPRRRGSIFVMDDIEPVVEDRSSEKRPSIIELAQVYQHGDDRLDDLSKDWAKQDSSLYRSDDDDSMSEATMASAKERLRADFMLWQSQEVQESIRDDEKEKVRRLSQRFQKAIAEEGSEKIRVSGVSDGELSFAGGSQEEDKASWVRLKGQTDFGTEVPYYYNPQSGDIRSMSFDAQEESNAWARLTAERRSALRMSDFEEHVEEYCRRAERRHSVESKARSSHTTQRSPSIVEIKEPYLEGSMMKSVTCCGYPIDESKEDEQPLLSDVQYTLLPSMEGLCQCPGDDGGEKRGGPTRGVSEAIDPFHGPATDYGRTEPGKVPWHMIKRGTLLMILLWMTGPLLSFGRVGGPLENGVPPLRAMDSIGARSDRDVDPARVASSAVDAYENNDLEALVEGEPIDVQWPREHSFMPRSLSCDPSGRQLVVADDFGVYSGHLWPEADSGARKLQGLSDLSIKISRAPPCTAFEGQTLKDIGVVCTNGAATESSCRVLVLHAHGRRLTECPLIQNSSREALAPTAGEVPLKTGSGLQGESPLAEPSTNDTSPTVMREHRARRRAPHKRKAVVKPVVTWRIAGQWLDVKKERVESVAVNNECLAQDRRTTGGAFHPDAPGCLVVGTTSGRVVQLRRHVTQSKELVPEWSMQKRTHAIGQGSLHVLPGGIVMALRPKQGTLQALDVQRGDVVGEWKLPQGISWITLCGGGRSLYMLGRALHSSKVGLWRFPIPATLQARQAQSAGRHGAVQEM